MTMKSTRKSIIEQWVVVENVIILLIEVLLQRKNTSQSQSNINKEIQDNNQEE